MAKKKPAAKRELLDTGTDKRFVRRDAKGRIKESDDVGKSLAQDVKKKAKTTSPPGQGDKGDQKKRRNSPGAWEAGELQNIRRALRPQVLARDFSELCSANNVCHARQNEGPLVSEGAVATSLHYQAGLAAPWFSVLELIAADDAILPEKYPNLPARLETIEAFRF